jgi:branched-chain amino acid transport system permease protein
MAQLIWNGLTIGCLYGLVAVGYTMLFGIIQVIFFAQGELSMLAAFAALLILAHLGSPAGTWSVAAWTLCAVCGAMAVSVLAGLLAERVALRPLKNAPRVKPLITSLGMSIVFQSSIMLAVGPQVFRFQLPFEIPRWNVLGVHFSLVELLMIAAAAICVGAIQAFLHWNRYGLAIRAIAQSPTGARLMGINPDRAIVVTFVIASLTASIAGLFMASYYGVVRFDMGFVPGIKGFTVAILGGVGNVPGAMVAGLLIGVAEALFTGFFSPDYRDLFVFTILILTLVLRPKGLLGEGS